MKNINFNLNHIFEKYDEKIRLLEEKVKKLERKLEFDKVLGKNYRGR